jgi:hypothetical protein
MLVKYLRRDGKPFACIVASGPGMIGYSVCHRNDNFDKVRAREIASGRARFAFMHEPDAIAQRVPHYAYDEVYDEVQRMLERADRYYKSEDSLAVMSEPHE